MADNGGGDDHVSYANSDGTGKATLHANVCLGGEQATLTKCTHKVDKDSISVDLSVEEYTQDTLTYYETGPQGASPKTLTYYKKTGNSKSGTIKKGNGNTIGGVYIRVTGADGSLTGKEASITQCTHSAEIGNTSFHVKGTSKPSNRTPI